LFKHDLEFTRRTNSILRWECNQIRNNCLN
jgi:hypothetical protein